jgi:ATP-dependent helicase/nuclease subunit B
VAVTFILGRAGAGKTQYCLSAVLRELDQPADTRRLILLVPEQASFQMERALATRAPGGGYWRAEVLSFSRLARRVFDQTGGEPVLVGGESRALALRHVVARMVTPLQALSAAARTQGFYVELARVIEELLREDVSPAALQHAADRLADGAAGRKTQEIAQLYADYLAWLGPGRIDAAARFALLRERLAGVTWLVDASVWADGFAGFTGQELQTLAALARRARGITISLLVDPAAAAVRNPGQPPDALDLFQRTELTYQRLLRCFADSGVEVAPAVELRPAPMRRFAGSSALAALEAGLVAPADGPPVADATPSGVHVYECLTHRDELTAAARWIRTLVADSRGALGFRDFAVIARDLEPLAPLVEEVFAEYEIPYFLDRRRPMRAHALARLMPALLDAVASDFAVDPVVRLLRTRLLPLSRDQVEQLENLVVHYQVCGMACWRQPTWELERAGRSVDAFAAQRARLAQALEPLAALVRHGSGATGAVWAATMFRALQQLDVPHRVEQWVADARRERRWEAGETHRLAWAALCRLLEDLHDALGETTLAPDDVAAILRTSLGELTLGLAPPTLDQVLVSSIERSRHPAIQHAWVLAFNEGVFPARPADDLLLSTTEREALCAAGLPAPSPHRADVLGERLLAYIAFTRPSQSLTISYATVAEDGGELLPSPLLAETVRAVPGLKPVRLELHQPPVTVGELAREYLGVRSDARYERERRRYERLCADVRRMPARAGPLSWLLRGVSYKNEPAAVAPYRRPASGAADVIWDGTPSEVEKYLQCPFKHFMVHGLQLDAVRGPRPLRWDLGEIGHQILARVTRRGMDAPGGVRAVPDQRWQDWLREAAEEFWRRQPADQAQRRPDLVFLGRVLTDILGDLLAAHVTRWRRGRFEPLYCEQRFDPGGGAAALGGIALTLADGRAIRLHGRIDRVDVCREGQAQLLLVYDYKSKAVGPIRAGYLISHRLQAFIYLLALQQAFVSEPGARAAGVLLAPLYPELGILDTQYAAEAAPIEQTMYLYRPRGLVEEVAARRLDDELGTASSPVAQLQLRKDSGFHKSSDAVPAAEIDGRLALAADSVRLAAEGICGGQIAVAPFLDNRRLACRDCDFGAVCRFDPMYNTPRVAERALPHLPRSEPDEGEEP